MGDGSGPAAWAHVPPHPRQRCTLPQFPYLQEGVMAVTPAGFSRGFSASRVQSAEQAPVTVVTITSSRGPQAAAGLGSRVSSWLCSLAGCMSHPLCPVNRHPGAPSRVSMKRGYTAPGELTGALAATFAVCAPAWRRLHPGAVVGRVTCSTPLPFFLRPPPLYTRRSGGLRDGNGPAHVPPQRLWSSAPET